MLTIELDEHKLHGLVKDLLISNSVRVIYDLCGSNSSKDEIMTCEHLCIAEMA